jgi:hypothetical protein
MFGFVLVHDHATGVHRDLQALGWLTTALLAVAAVSLVL